MDRQWVGSMDRATKKIRKTKGVQVAYYGAKKPDLRAVGLAYLSLSRDEFWEQVDNLHPGIQDQLEINEYDRALASDPDTLGDSGFLRSLTEAPQYYDLTD